MSQTHANKLLYVGSEILWVFKVKPSSVFDDFTFVVWLSYCFGVSSWILLHFGIKLYVVTFFLKVEESFVFNFFSFVVHISLYSIENVSSLEWAWVVSLHKLKVLKIILWITVHMDQWLSQLCPVECPGIISSWRWLKSSVMLRINLKIFKIIHRVSIYMNQRFSELAPVKCFSIIWFWWWL